MQADVIKRAGATCPFSLASGRMPCLPVRTPIRGALMRVRPRGLSARPLARRIGIAPPRRAVARRSARSPTRGSARSAARRGRYAEPDARQKRAWGGGRGGKKAHYHTGAFFPPSSFAGMIFEGARRVLCQGREAAREAGEPLTQCPPCATSSSLAPKGRRRPDAARPKRGPIPPPGSLRARRAGAAAGV